MAGCVMRRIAGALFLIAAFLPALKAAAETAPLDIVEIDQGVYALVGQMAQRSADNLGNNATFGLIVTAQGAVLIDPGGSARGAAQLHRIVRQLTDQPIRFVIDTGGQDHRWFGNDYFRKQGAKIIASEDAVADQQERADIQYQAMEFLLGKDVFAGTEPASADIRFDKRYVLQLGDLRIEIVHPGAAHTPGDSFVYLPQQKILFAGDIVYMDRLLGIGEQSDTAAWLESFAAIEALHPRIVVPGHGYPAPLAKAQKETRDYLRYMRAEVDRILERGGDIAEARNIDQSAFAYLAVADQIARRNAETLYRQMEFE